MKYVILMVNLSHFSTMSAQNILVEYQSTKEPPKFDTNDDVPDDVKLLLQKQHSITTNFILKSTPQESIFTKFEKEDNLLDERKVNFFEDNINVYKNRVTNTYKMEVPQFLNKEYLIVDNLGYLDWKIEDEYQSILDIQCQKATASYNEKDIIAWFAESIPISDGPFDYHGLPGLILKVETIVKSYTATAIEFTEAPLKITFDAKGEKIGRNEFLEHVKSLGGK